MNNEVIFILVRQTLVPDVALIIMCVCQSVNSAQTCLDILPLEGSGHMVITVLIVSSELLFVAFFYCRINVPIGQP